MKAHFEKLTEAKKEYKERTGEDYTHVKHHSGLRIYTRNRKKGSKSKRKYFLGTYLQWLNL